MIRPNNDRRYAGFSGMRRVAKTISDRAVAATRRAADAVA
jgi:hypothetical protein